MGGMFGNYASLQVYSEVMLKLVKSADKTTDSLAHTQETHFQEVQNLDFKLQAFQVGEQAQWKIEVAGGTALRVRIGYMRGRWDSIDSIHRNLCVLSGCTDTE
jgi:hypothetical protein